MTPATTEKICYLCGACCAGVPRVRDQTGRYFHRSCFRKARERSGAPPRLDGHDAKKAERPAPTAARGRGPEGPDREPAPPAAPARNGSENGAPNGRTGALARPRPSRWPNAGPPPLTGGAIVRSGEHPRELDAGPAFRACPACGTMSPSVASVCTACGRDLGSSARDEAASGQRSAERAWPAVCGTASMAFGCAGLLVYAPLLALTLDAAAGESVAAWVARLPLIAIATALVGTSLWLSREGIGLLRRRRSAIDGIRWWAAAKLLLVAAAAAWFWTAEPFGQGRLALALAVAAAIWLGYWPILLLVWCRRRAVRRERLAWS